MTNQTTEYLDRPDGRVSYDDNGAGGPLVIAAPGIGDTRHVYRFVRDELAAAGLRFVTMDLRGMGDTSVGWDQLNDAAVASDYLALIDELDAGPAVLVGNSLSCAAAVLAATDASYKVAGLVLVGPFVRDLPMKWWQKAAFAMMLAPPWGRSAWVNYYRKKMYPGAPPADLDEYVAALSANLKEPGRFADFRSLSMSSHAESGRRIDKVAQPVVVLMGTADPDFPDPGEEANEIAGIMNAEVVWSEGSGHYPQAETPQVFVDAVKRVIRQTQAG